MTLSIYRDLVQNTTSVNLNTGRKVQQHVSKHTYLLPYLLKGADGFKSVQGGKDIRFDNYMKKVSTYRNVSPNQKHTWSNPQITNSGFAHWRFSLDEQNLNMVEVLLQASNMSPGMQVDYYVETRDKIELRTTISYADGMEDELHALPVWSDMEHADGLTPNSLAAFCNEMSDGLYHSYRTANGGNGKLLDIDPAEYPVWKNQVDTYDEVGAYSTGRHLFTGFDSIMQDMHFAQIPGPGGAKFSENAYGMKSICTQKAGLTNYMQSLRENNDITRSGPQDPAYPTPLYNGIPIMRIEALETEPIYPTANGDAYAATPTETSYDIYSATGGPTNAGPRYHFYDFNHVRKAFHKDRYFEKLDIIKPSNQVETLIQPILCYQNNITNNRRVLGVLRPSTDIPV